MRQPTREPSLPSEARLAGPVAPAADAVAALVGPLLDAGRLLVVSDFDGTLAHLVADPWGATIVPAAQRALRRLATTPGVSVALLSGRSVADLAGRARIGGISYLGDHGAERAEAVRGFRPPALVIRREPAPAPASEMARCLAERVPRAVPDAWLVVEPKGSALTFHFRAAADVADARARVTSAVDGIDPERLLVRWAGRRSLELRPHGASDKGLALGRLVEEQRPSAVIMLGDDHSDVRAFATLRSMRARGVIEGLAIAVAGHADVSAEVAPSADVLLPSPAAAGTFLRHLASLAQDHRLAGDSASGGVEPDLEPEGGPRRDTEHVTRWAEGL